MKGLEVMSARASRVGPVILQPLGGEVWPASGRQGAKFKAMADKPLARQDNTGSPTEELSGNGPLALGAFPEVQGPAGCHLQASQLGLTSEDLQGLGAGFHAQGSCR
jgi:hypothetical protein